jgi:hypothetical protein
LDDIPGDAYELLDHVVRSCSDYEIWGHQLEFRGLCPQCQQEHRHPYNTRASSENPGTNVHGAA